MPKVDEHFRVKYEVGRFSAEGIKAEGKGGTDGFLFCSVVHLPDGGLDVQTMSVDGRTGKNMSAHEQFKIWLFLTKRLAASADLEAWAKAVCQTALDAFQTVFTKAVAEPLSHVAKVDRSQ